jgi:hypothetical protein
MKKKLTIITFLVINIFTYSQVGIATQTPTETFDVEGTARIRSLPLNGTTNTINTKIDGTKSNAKDQTFTAIKTVVSDNNGVIGTLNYLPAQNSVIITGANGTDAIMTSKTASSKNGVAGTTPPLLTKVFTLNKKSMVTFSYNLSVGDITTSTGASLMDGTSKRLASRLLLNGSVIINEGIPFSNSGSYYASGYFYLNGSRTILLNAGSYTLNIEGNVFAWAGDNIGITATFGGTSDDQLDIIAVPVE